MEKLSLSDVPMPGKPRVSESKAQKASKCKTCSDQGIMHIEGQPDYETYKQLFETEMPCPMRCSASLEWVKAFDAYEEEKRVLGPEMAGTDAALSHWHAGKLYKDRSEIVKLVNEQRREKGNVAIPNR